MGDYTEDMDRAIEQLDSINLQDTARRRPSISSSSLSEEGLGLLLFYSFFFPLATGSVKLYLVEWFSSLFSFVRWLNSLNDFLIVMLVYF